jgi:hypothetical protein
MSSHVQTVLKRTATMVDRWQGHPARLIELTKSHPTLVLVVGDEVYGKNLYIALLSPQYICGPTRWEHALIVLQTARLDSGEEVVVLTDEESGVRVVAESIAIHENVKW